MVSNRLLIGLTGGMGSGKTTVADLFAEYGITIIDADLITRELVLPGTNALHAIVKHFGADILDDTGALNRQALRDRIFKNPQERLWLEQLLHPQVMEEIKKRAQ
jgi:dephospho-CoA kinase